MTNMKIRWVIPLLLLLLAIPASAQQTQTSVTGTITDPNSVPYYPATVLACLTPPTTNPTVAGAPISTNVGVPYCVGPAQTGTTGTFQIPLYANGVISCGNVTCTTQWQFTVTATGTAPPAGKGAQNFQVNITITNLTAQDVSSPLNAAAPVLLNSGGGSSIGPGTPTFLGCFSSTTNVQNCTDAITDVSGLVTIPANMVVGTGGGAASVTYPSGATSGCQTPTAGFNIICSDGTLNTMDLALNGASYIPIATVSGTPTTGNCASFASAYAVGDSGNPCPVLPGTISAHTFFGNNTASSGPLNAAVPIGTNDLFPNIYCVTTGSADAYVATLPVVATALTAGVVVNISPNFTNATTAPTLAVSGFSAKNILKIIDGTLVNVVPGDIATNANAQLLYDGTEFQLLNPATTRSMWPCAPQVGLSDLLDATVITTTETLFATACKIPAGTLLSGVIVDGQLGIDWTATATIPNSTFKMYLCPTLQTGTPSGCKGIYTSATTAANPGSLSSVLPIMLIGRGAASSTAAINQQIGSGTASNVPSGRNSFGGSITNVTTNADLFLQFSITFAAGTAGNTYTIRSLIFR